MWFAQLPDPASYGSFGQQAPYVYIVAAVLAFCSSVITAILLMATERHRLKAQTERDNQHAGFVDKLHGALQDNHGLYQRLQQELQDHCQADEVFHADTTERLEAVREDLEDIRIALGVRKGGALRERSAGSPGSPNPPPGGGGTPA
jgi:hypothetical protein